MKICLQYKPDLGIEYHNPAAGIYEEATALSVAINKGNTEIVRLLLEAGANFNQRVFRNNLPLQYGYTLKVHSDGPLRALLEYRPDLDLIDDDGDTALHCLKKETPLSRVKLLVNAGADIEIRNKNLLIPLCIAIECQNIEVVEYLLSKNVQVNLTGGKYGGPLLVACWTSNLPLMKLVVEKGLGNNVNLADPGWLGTTLQAVCRYSSNGADDTSFPLVSYLLDDANANINASGGYMGYALIIACLMGNLSLVKLLLSKGANSDVADSMGRKPIHIAALRTIDYFELLGEEKFLKSENKLKRLPLHYAVVTGRVDFGQNGPQAFSSTPGLKRGQLSRL